MKYNKKKNYHMAEHRLTSHPNNWAVGLIKLRKEW